MLAVRHACVSALVATVLIGALGVVLAVAPKSYLQVNVHWGNDVPARSRNYVEQRRSLTPIRQDDPGVWLYLLTDVSRENVAALFATPGVQSVRFLDHATLAPTEYQTTTMARWIDLRFGTTVSALLRPLGLLPLSVGAFLIALLSRSEGRRWLASRIPVARPATLGVFRVVLAFALLPLILPALPPEAPPLASTMRLAALSFLGVFAVGAAARLSLFGFIVSFAIVFPDQLGSQDLALPIRTLFLLCFVPWDAGFSVDQEVRRRAGWRLTPDVPSRRYGLGLWLPVMMVGVAYASAAFAKVDQSGMKWITGAAARYFIIADNIVIGGSGAPGEIWRTVASSESLSRIVSVGTLLVESLVIVAAIWFRPVVVLVAGLAAAGLHAGFWFLQGQWWPGWWALLTAFLPWEPAVTWVRNRLPARTESPTAPPAGPALNIATAPAGTDITVLASTVLVIVLLQQCVVSFLAMERPPYVSSYQMNADVNWESKEEFAEAMFKEHYPKAPAIRFEPDTATRIDGFASRLVQVDENRAFAEAAVALSGGEDIGDDLRSRLRLVASNYQARFGEPLPPVRVLTAGWRFDWSAAGFVPEDAWERGPTMTLPPAGP